MHYRLTSNISRTLVSNTRARLGRVAPLGQPRSVYKSDVECRFVSWNGQMTMKVTVNASHFQYQLRETQDTYSVLFFILAQIHKKLLHWQDEIPEIWSKWPKLPWRLRSMTSIFNTLQEYPRMHVWCKFGNCSPNLWRVTDKSNFIESWVKMAKITLQVKVNDPYIQYQPTVSHDACVVQIWRF